MESDKKQMNIQIKPEVACGKYSNLAIISHSPTEFVIDFAAMLPATPQPEVVSRIIMNPEHAKRLMSALVENVRKYEATFGTIKTSAPAGSTFNLADFMGNGSNKS